MKFIYDYFEEVELITKSIDAKCIDLIIKELVKLKKRNGRLFILGVGGSAGNSSHAVNDFRKLTGIESYAPTDNVSEITARTNDEGWDTIFSSYLQISQLNDSDCILVLSVGGGNYEKNVSVNLCKAIEFAKSKKTMIIGIVGKEGGYTHIHADICLLIPSVNPLHITPHSEAFQSIVWHLLVSHPDLKINETKW